MCFLKNIKAEIPAAAGKKKIPHDCDEEPPGSKLHVHI